MSLNIINFGHKAPSWVLAVFQDYQKRLSKPYDLNFIQSKAKLGSCAATLKDLEKNFPEIKKFIALDSSGEQFDSVKFSAKLAGILSIEKNLSFIIGPASGLAPCLLEKAVFSWSLSKLTFGHSIVVPILAEQLYRAYTISRGHPYHLQH